MIATQYTGTSVGSETIFTVPAGKICKVLFKQGNNYAYDLSYTEDALLRLNGRNIAGTKDDNADSSPYDGEKLAVNDSGGVLEDHFYVSSTSPLIMIAGEDIGTLISGGRFRYDFTVLEETL